MDFLKSLNINDTNLGGCTGQDWFGQGSRLVSYNPATGKAIAEVTTTNTQEYEACIQKSLEVKNAWAMTPAPKRGELVRRIGELLREHKDALGSLVSLEMGKIKAEGDGEVQEMIDMAEYAVGLSRSMAGQTLQSERPYHRLYEQWHPLGVVGVISAFNFPVAVWSWNAFISAVCGNVTVWKPSEKTPLCAIAVQNLCNQAMSEMGLDGIFSLFIPESTDIAKEFVADKRVPLISFTGSTQVGKEVNKVVAGRMGRSLLELSGNNAIIVDETADLNLAIRGIVFGAVGTAGQRCTTTRRLLVHKSRFDEVVEALKAAYPQVSVGDPLDEKTLMGPLIDEGSVANFQTAIAETQDAGGKILFGGRVLEGKGYFVEPTLVEIEPHAEIVKQETFAPILYVSAYKDFEEAIAIQNSVSHGLSSSIFSNDIRKTEAFLSALGSDCGIANVNIGTSGAEIGGAFGGEKDTGGGREAGSDSWKAYMRRQTNTINWGKELPLAQGIEFNL